MRTINAIVLHCSDSSGGTAVDVHKWHTYAPPEGNGWSDTGYQFVIENGLSLSGDYDEDRDGLVVPCRPMETPGAHARDHNGVGISNSNSIGVCLIGKDGVFTPRQILELGDLVVRLQAQFDIPPERVVGHRDVDNRKTCPDFDVGLIRRWLGKVHP